MTPRSPWHRAAVALLCVAVVGAVALASLFLGGKDTDPAEVVRVMTGGGNPYLEAVLAARVDRTVIGLLCGAALAMSGVLIQGVTRNPLGDPGLLGVTIGASAATVTAAAVTGAGVGAGSVWVAFSGALVTVVLVYVVGSRSASGSVVSLLLTGAVVSALLSAYVQAMILTHPAVFDSFRFWVIGAVNGRGLDVAASVAPALFAGTLAAMILAPSLNVLALGDDAARALGTRLSLVRAGTILAAALLAGAATAAAGPVAFVGLAVPHLARAIVGTDHRRQLPAAALMGAVLLVLADIVGRIVARPEEIMVGIVTAMIGAPFLLFAVRRGWVTR